MKKLEISQMESLQGGLTREQWCGVAVIFGVGAGLFTGGAAGALTIAAAAATGLSC